MKRNQIYMLTKTLTADNFKHLLIPAMMSMMGEYVLLLSDNMIAGKMIGDRALAAITICQPYFTVVVFVNSLMLLGTAILSSRAVGEENRHRANQLFSQGIILSIIVGVLFTLVSVIFKSQIFSIFKLHADTYMYVEQYFSWLRYYPLFTFYFVIFTMVMNEGGGKWCNISSVTMVVSNIIFSIVLCHYMGMEGISMGSILGLALASVVLSFQFFQKNNPLRFIFYFKWRDVFNVLKYGSTESFFYLFMAIIYMFFNWFLLKYFNSDSLIIFTIVMNIETLLITGYDGLSQAVQPLVAIYQGEGNLIGISKTMKVTLFYSTIITVIFMAVVLILSPLIPSAFGVYDSSLAASSILAVRIFLLSSVFLVWGLLLSSYMLYTGRILLSLVIMLLIIILFTIPLAFYSGIYMGLTAIWATFSISVVIGILSSCYIVYRIAHRNNATFPWLLNKAKLKRQVSFDVLATEENSRVLMDKVEVELEKKGFEQRQILKILLMLEETFMLNLDKAKKKEKYYVECTLLFEEKLYMIIRDNGEYSDATDVNAMPSSLRQYLSTMIISQHRGARFSTTMGDNRVIYEF